MVDFILITLQMNKQNSKKKSLKFWNAYEL